MNYIFIHMKNMLGASEIQDIQELQKRLKRVGGNFFLGKDYTVVNPQCISIGDGFGAKERFRIEAICRYEGDEFTPEIIIGNDVIFNTDIHIGCIDRIEIGDNCLFASRIYISDHDHGKTNFTELLLPPVKRKLFSKGPVIIQNNVWVGEGVSILSGVTVGKNSIIASNAVVTKNVPANSIVGGIPAKTIKIIHDEN